MSTIYIPIWSHPYEIDPIDKWLDEFKIDYKKCHMWIHPDTYQPHIPYIIYDERDELLFRLKWATKITNENKLNK